MFRQWLNAKKSNIDGNLGILTERESAKGDGVEAGQDGYQPRTSTEA